MPKYPGSKKGLFLKKQASQPARLAEQPARLAEQPARKKKIRGRMHVENWQIRKMTSNQGTRLKVWN